jgi:F420-dependent oxidoreductase-like protein
MKLGLHCSNFTWLGGPAAMGQTLALVARRLEAAGFYSLSVMDHFFQIPPVGPAEREMHEAYTTLGVIADATERLRLGTIVTGVTYRHPGFLVKQVTTLDVLSGGRAWFGIGAAWFEREHAGLGIPFPPLRERFERLEEALQIAHQMWSDNDGPYEGTHYRLAETINSPQPLARPHPPIMIGGAGEKKTLRLVARYADACNLFARPDTGPAAVEAKLDVLSAHCLREGTDYHRIRKTILWTGPLETTAAGGAAFADQMRGYAELGIDEVHVMPLTADPVALVDGLGDHVVPRLSAL